MFYKEEDHMAKFERTDRVSEEVRRNIDTIIREEVKDPRLSGTYTVLRADVTRDFRWCNVYISVLENEKREPVMEALNSAKGFIRRELGKRMQIHYTPELVFKLDTNIEYAAYVDKLLKDEAKKMSDQAQENEHGDE